VIETVSITILLEGLVCLAYSIWQRKPTGSIFITSIFANLITQSLLWVGLNLFYNHYLITLFIAEILIWLIESFWLHLFPKNKLDLKEAACLSLMMNVASFGIGWFLPM
jgi:hypothetical protein